MAASAAAPVEVGAQGTIGSLVCREIEHFRRMEVAVSHGHGKKSNSSKQAAAAVGSPMRTKARSPWKKGAAGPFLPRMCSSAEVAEAAAGAAGAARVRYRHLGEDEDDLPQE